MNKWKEVWNKRTARFDGIDPNDCKRFFLELKRIDGFDIQTDGMSYDTFVRQYEILKSELAFVSGAGRSMPVESVFEVGCGCGANLYLFQKDKIRVGGIDYSEVLVNTARRILQSELLEECICDEAVNMPTEIKYDSVCANGVFHYFPNEAYAKQVLEKMLQKCNRSIGILDIHDIEQKEKFINYRKKITVNYEELYKGLDKLFYSKQFFLDFAERHQLDIKFCQSNMEGYWNNSFVFHCFLIKK